MALRHALPDGVKELQVHKELKIAPAMRPAKVVEFRRGVDMKVLAADIMDAQSVKVVAAVGAGKSVLLPKELSMASKTLVFHVTPGRLLARSLFAYVSKCANENSAEYPELALLHAWDAEIPRIGVVFCGAAEMVALVSQRDLLRERGNVVIYLDEAHESDAYTYVLRNLALSLGARALVQASATFSGGDFLKKELPGKLRESTYSADLVPEDWEVAKPGFPWSVSNIRENILIFTDSRRQSERLLDQYRTFGFKAFRLEAGMPADEFDEAMAATRDSKGCLVALIADYSFRSGFTFHVSNIVDTGRVSRFDSKPGVLSKVSRQIFRFEAEQSAGRGGRVPGLSTTYYRPRVDLESVMCDLEGVEMEAAALLYRVLGYAVSADLKGCLLASKDLPEGVSLVGALKGTYPLTYYLVDRDGNMRVEARAAEYEVTPVGSEGSRESAGVASLGGETFVDAAEFGAGGSAEGISAGVGDVDTEDVGETQENWNEFVSMLGDDMCADLRVGEYYYSPDCDSGGVAPASLVFPAGLGSILAFVADDRAVHGLDVMTSADRKYAIKTALDRYNLLNAEIKVIRECIMTVFRSGISVGRLGLLRTRMSNVLARLARQDAERGASLRAISVMAGREYPLLAFSGLQGFEAKRREFYMDLFQAMRNELTEDRSAQYIDELESGDVPHDLPGVSGKAHRRKHHRRRSVVHEVADEVSSGSSTVTGCSVATKTVVPMPFWTGMKSVAYRVQPAPDGTGRLSAEVKSRPFVQMLTGIKSRRYSDDGSEKTKYLDGSTRRLRAS